MASKGRKYNRSISCHTTFSAANSAMKKARKAGWTAQKPKKNKKTGKWCIPTAGKRKSASRKKK